LCISNLFFPLNLSFSVATGKVTYGAIAALLSLYIIYVIIVAVADFTKRAGVEWGDIGVRLSKNVSMRIRRNGSIAPLLPRSGSGASASGDIDNNVVEYDTRNGRYPGRDERNGLDEVESEVPEEVLPTVTLVPPATTTTAGNLNTFVNRNNTLDHSNSNGSRKSNASEVELMTSPPISRQRSPVRGAQSLPAPFDAPALGSSGGDAVAGSATNSQPTRRSQTLGYEELVHMSAKEYRQRALADMAAATSFYKGRRGGGAGAGDVAADAVADLEALDESEEEEEEELEEREAAERDEERGEYTPPEIPPLAATGNETQQNLQLPPLPPTTTTARAPRAASAPAALSLPPALSVPHSIKSVDGGQYGRTAPRPVAIPEENQEESAATSKFDQRLASFGQALESAAKPVMFLLKSTIPIVEMTSYDKFWFLIAMAASPFFICLYLGILSSFKNCAIAVAVGALSSTFCALCTRHLNEIEAPLWDFGTGYPLGAGLVAFYGFAVAAMWIDVFASNIVGILHFFGLLAGVQPAVLGVTVLSWGNSLTDFVANTSMAGRSAGGTSMAMTACFAGPLFNMLVGLGIGFWAYLADTKQRSTPVKFDSVVLVGCIFAMLNCAGVVAVAVKKKHRLPGRFGWVMCGWYVLYMFVVLIMCIS
jgi:Ca2+/Na+ antiporter